MASILGAGAFKTAHPGWFAPPSSGLGSKTCNDVAVKRAYYKAYPPGASSTSLKFKIGHYALPDEVNRLIKRQIASEPPPFNIPQVRFVDAGIAFAFGPLPVSKAASKWSASSDEFLKYIHNMDSNPLLDDPTTAFISDYQGSFELLTDPQILMHLTVSPGVDIFGDGNMEVAVSFGLHPFATQADGSIDDTEPAANGSSRDDADVS
ncbi:hypothetical protein DFH29DRAFT_993968 [Suillus ampliporus]|nr:hypothetical protein DFH29DRAFT_993968 [Suillus ampliporus]